MSISASPTACPLRGYGRAGTQNDRLGERLQQQLLNYYYENHCQHLYRYQHRHRRRHRWPASSPSSRVFHTRASPHECFVHRSWLASSASRPIAWTSAMCARPERVLFLATFSADADAERRGARVESEGSVGKRVPARRTLGCLQVDACPRRSPSAGTETLQKKERSAGVRMDVIILGPRDGHDEPSALQAATNLIAIVQVWTDSSMRFFWRCLGARRQRTPRTCVDLEVSEDASRRDLSDAALRFDPSPRRSASASAEKVAKNRTRSRAIIAIVQVWSDSSVERPTETAERMICARPATATHMSARIRTHISTLMSMHRLAARLDRSSRRIYPLSLQPPSHLLP